MVRALITGVNGFVGSHLSEFLLENSLAEVYGTFRTKNENMENIRGIVNKINPIECDITDYHAVSQAIEEVEPDYVFHLAAQAFVPSSWSAPVETMNTNVMGSLNLFEAIRRSKSDPVVQIAGSSEEYGLVKEDEVPIKETNPLRPLSPYGVSKVSMDLLGFQYHQSYGVKIVRTRGFNHTGPRRGESYVTSNWSKQIAEMEKGVKEKSLLVGNLDSVRDFTDVRDMVRGYWLAVKKAEPGDVYNIAAGKGVKMSGLLEMLKGLSKTEFAVKPDPKRMRPSDVMVLIGDSSKFREKTGWKPEIEFRKTLEDLLDYWRERV